RSSDLLMDDEPAPVSAPRQAPARELPLRESPVQPEPVVQQEQIQLSELQAELADMRFLLEQQLDRMMGGTPAPQGSPVLSSIGRRLERIGLPDDVVNKVLNSCKPTDRKSTRLNSSHVKISYAVFCLKKTNWQT